ANRPHSGLQNRAPHSENACGIYSRSKLALPQRIALGRRKASAKSQSLWERSLLREWPRQRPEMDGLALENACGIYSRSKLSLPQRIAFGRRKASAKSQSLWERSLLREWPRQRPEMDGLALENACDIYLRSALALPQRIALGRRKASAKSQSLWERSSPARMAANSTRKPNESLPPVC